MTTGGPRLPSPRSLLLLQLHWQLQLLQLQDFDIQRFFKYTS